MQDLQQISTVTALSIRSLPQRLGSSTIIVVSIAGVVAVLIGVLTLADSLLRTIGGATQPDRAIVLIKGARAEGGSNLQRTEVSTIQAAPGIGKNAAGHAIASPEVIAVVAVREKKDNARAEVVVRGVTALAFDLRPEIKVIAGRLPQTGLHELLVGQAAANQYKSLDLGNQVTMRGVKWTVVGLFAAEGNLRESELFADAETLMSAYQRTTFQSVAIKLATADSFTTLKDALTTDPSLSVDVVTETQYYSQQYEFLGKILQTIAYIVGGIMAVGAMSGAINCMYSAISARGIEIATLRAIGFSAFSVVASVLAEALLLALIGAAIGAAIAWLLLSGNSFSTQVGMGPVVSQLQVAPSLIVVGVAWACTIGFLGGLVPALRAARIPVATALREI